MQSSSQDKFMITAVSNRKTCKFLLDPRNTHAMAPAPAPKPHLGVLHELGEDGEGPPTARAAPFFPYARRLTGEPARKCRNFRGVAVPPPALGTEHGLAPRSSLTEDHLSRRSHPLKAPHRVLVPGLRHCDFIAFQL